MKTKGKHGDGAARGARGDGSLLEFQGEDLGGLKVECFEAFF